MGARIVRLDRAAALAGPVADAAAAARRLMPATVAARSLHAVEGEVEIDHVGRGADRAQLHGVVRLGALVQPAAEAAAPAPRGVVLQQAVAVGVPAEGYREILGIREGAEEKGLAGRASSRTIKGRGLAGVQLIVPNTGLDLGESVAKYLPRAWWQC